MRACRRGWLIFGTTVVGGPLLLVQHRSADQARLAAGPSETIKCVVSRTTVPGCWVVAAAAASGDSLQTLEW